MKGKFKVLIESEIKRYTDYDDIPDRIGAVISFMPDYPEPPHTEEEHALIHTFQDKLKELVQRESCQLR